MVRKIGPEVDVNIGIIFVLTNAAFVDLDIIELKIKKNIPNRWTSGITGG